MISRTLRIVPAALAGVSLAALATGQPTGTSPLNPPPSAMKQADPTWHALTGATVHVAPGQTVEGATVVIRDGRIVSVAPGGAAPAGARAWDATGLHVYAGFIDANVEVDAPKPDPKAAGVHWNARITPQRSALDGTGVDTGTSESLRKLGFTAAAISPRGGIFRGSAAVVSLAKPAPEASADRPPVYVSTAYQSVALEQGGWGSEGGPSSEMGAIALLRQTLIDADWQRAARAAGERIARNALDSVPAPATEGRRGTPLLMNADNELELLRVVKVAEEFGRSAAVLGSGTEYKRLAAIRGLTSKPVLVIPLNFPRTPDVSSIGRAESTDLQELMSWEQAPTNPRRLDGAGFTVALTTAKLRDRGQFAENLQKAIKHGLSAERALAMLTINPAQVLGVHEQMGTVEAGKRANLVVADGDLFAPAAPKEGEEKKTAKIRDVWIDGVRHEIAPAPDKAAVGLWKTTEADGKPVDPEAPGTPQIIIDEKNAVTVQVGEKKVKATNVRIAEGRVEYVYDARELGGTGVVADQATVEGESMIGISLMPDGSVHRWKARRFGDPPKEPAREGARPGMAGRWRMTTIDGQAREPGDERFIVIKEDRSVMLTGMGQEIAPGDVTVEGDAVSYTLDMARLGGEGVVKVSGTREGDVLKGTMIVPDGSTHTWQAERVQPEKPAEPGKEEGPDEGADVPETYGYPFGPYMMDELPPQERILVINATIWTSGPLGVIREGALLVSGGKIQYVGPSASLPRIDDSFRTIDASGKHVTPGLIDCHSHTGISGGVNEGVQSCTAEVRIGDVTNPDSINWYRQLAGGVTAVNSLHGSANPIGGQNQVNKVRWGVLAPDDMHFEGARPGIKFALGENVKRSRSSSNTRYPDTRMGVETFIRDRFTAAREYATVWRAWEASDKKGLPPRRDLELEALAEILAGRRLVHCHSYRQDEILMLARMSASLGFKLGTYQHGLECYKVADAVRESALGASLFSDWWNYKVEVQDAIPQAGPILHEQGVVVSFNSDSDELARRMNVEAGKAVKYGALPPEEALKFVTINPAIQLAVADRVGSLEAGKDADFAIWSGPPLSALSRCEATFIDGREYFSLARDAAHRERIASERERLIQKVLRQGRGTDSARPGRPEGASARRRPPSEEEAAAVREYYLRKLGRGLTEDAADCGDCGLGLEHALHGNR